MCIPGFVGTLAITVQIITLANTERRNVVIANRIRIFWTGWEIFGDSFLHWTDLAKKLRMLLIRVTINVLARYFCLRIAGSRCPKHSAVFDLLICYQRY